MSNIKERIIAELEKRGAKLPCSRCGHREFALLDDFARIDQQKNFSNVSLGGPAIPCAMVACRNCGNVNLHALGVLGMMDEVTKTENPKGGSSE